MPGSTPEYTWVVQPTIHRAAVTTDPRLGINIADESSRPETEYYIRVQAANKGKQGLLVGRSNPFMIGPSLSKREDSAEANKLSTSTEEPILPVADTNSADADLSTVPEPVAHESALSSYLEPSGGLIDPTVPVAPITDAPVFPETPQDSPQDSPPVSTPTTFHNPPMAVAEEVKKKQTPGEIFLKYAGAGAGILSTIGVGVGGLVGGVIGGTVGLVLGLVLAAANAAFYA
ncbi:hypothetical protein BGZ75_002088 [Mortierella antarctica]|nr:hypothetical protein BGZ75_002088 [Mortierella antarctica]